MPSFFVGNVLPNTDAKGENDPTFDFTKEESANMDLSDVPIRIEHAEGLAVGHVQRHWNDSDGKKWILGKVDDSTLEGRFASNALEPSSDGHRLYTGLSLQHVHTSFSDGTTKKRPIEVSLCTEPRRAGCNVISTQQQSASGQGETKKTEYITQHQASIKMSAPIEETQSETQEQVVETPAQVETPAPAAAESQVTNQEDLMKLVINQESELGDTKMALQKAEAQLTKLQEQWKQQQDNAELETKSKAEALSKALVDSWSASLPADMMTDENKKAIFAMAQNYPKESVKMLEIAHKASAKYKTDLDSLASQAQAKSKRALETQVMDIVTKKRRVALVAPPQQSVVHAASAKVAAVRNPFAFDSSKTQSSSMNSVRDRNPALFQALAGFGSGNLRDRMGQISKIDGN